MTFFWTVLRLLSKHENVTTVCIYKDELREFFLQLHPTAKTFHIRNTQDDLSAFANCIKNGSAVGVGKIINQSSDPNGGLIASYEILVDFVPDPEDGDGGPE